MPKIYQKCLFKRVGQSLSNTDVVTVNVADPAQWIQVVAIASNPNAGATLSVQASPSTQVTDIIPVKNQYGVAVTLDLNNPVFVKLNDISIDNLVFTPSGLTTGTYKVIVSYVAEYMEKNEG